MNRSKKYLLMLILTGFILCTAAAGARAQTVWMVCTWDTSSIGKDQSGRQKFERRFYVSPLVSISKEEFLKIDGSGDRIEGLCGDYLDKTVVKAATNRGERLDPGGTLKIIRNIELSGENLGSPNPYNFASKEKIEKQRDEAIKDWVGTDRVIYEFNWDPAGKNEKADFEAESKRTGPAKPKP